MFWKRRIYADAAAATPLSSAARREMLRLLQYFGNPGALHKEAVIAKKELERARKKIAEAIGAHADELVFTASGTEGNNLAIQGVLRPLLAKHASVHAIVSAVEHQSVLEPLRALQEEGLALTELGVDEKGEVFPSAVADALRPDTAFVSVQLINSEIGTVEPLREIAKEIRRGRHHRNEGDLPLLLHTDASQAPLWMAVDVEKLGVDLLTLDAQKVLGPKGVGALYIRRGVSVAPVLYGGKQERGLRGGTENLPLIGAFAEALVAAQRGVARRVKRVAATRDYLFELITRALPEVVLHGPSDAPGAPGEKRAANNLNLSIPGLDGEMAVIAMDAQGVAVSTRSACTIGDESPSHVIEAINVAPELRKTAIRITLLPDVSKAQAKRIVRALVEASERYRKR